VRAGDGTIVLPGRCVALHLRCQSDVAALMLGVRSRRISRSPSAPPRRPRLRPACTPIKRCPDGTPRVVYALRRLTTSRYGLGRVIVSRVGPTIGLLSQDLLVQQRPARSGACTPHRTSASSQVVTPRSGNVRATPAYRRAKISSEEELMSNITRKSLLALGLLVSCATMAIAQGNGGALVLNATTALICFLRGQATLQCSSKAETCHRL
jgi:hypothetical protein